MFEVGFSELLLVLVVALLVLGPREMAVAMRFMGRLVYRVRRFTARIWSDIDIMMYNEDIEELNRKIRKMHDSAPTSARDDMDGRNDENAE